MASYKDKKRKLLDEMLQRGPTRWDASEISQDDLDGARLGASAFEQVGEDEGSLAAQQEASNRYKEMADNGGYTAQDRAATLRGQKAANQQDAARRRAILSEMQQRGAAGSGAELAARLASADSAAERNSEDSQETAARGEARRDAAIGARANLAGQMRDQSYRRQSNLAQARDGVSRFNADLAGRAAFQNNQTRNQSGQYNTGTQNQFDQRGFEYSYNDIVDEENRRIAEDERRRGNKAAKRAMVGGLIGAGVGAYAGGPQGAQAGSQLGSQFGAASSYSKGGKVEGCEVVEGDHEDNDVIPAWLSAEEIVIPKTKADDPIEAAEFVAEENEEEIDVEDALRAIALALKNLDNKTTKKRS